MMETLIAVSLLLVVSVAISTSVTNQSGEKNPNYSWLKTQGRLALSSADDLGILRPSIYLNDNPAYSAVIENYQQDLVLLITAQLPTIANFVLLRVDLTEIEGSSTVSIVGTGTYPDETTTVYVASYFLGGYSSFEYGSYNESYALYLSIWLLS